MAKKYYSVSEFAEAAGVSTQTIYQQLKKGRLRNYGRRVDGKQRIKAEALGLFKTGQDAQREADPEPEEASVAEVQLLRELLAEKDKRIEDLQQALLMEHETLKQQQEIMREEIETIKGQITAQYLLHGGDVAREQEPPAADPEPEEAQETQTENVQTYTQEKTEEPPAYQEKPGFFTRVFSRFRE